MPDLYVDVDAAVVVPVNVLPLTDDTDFKTRETGVAYNAAGMDLVWNFVTPAGVFTQTAVTPTTSGDYDWTHKGDGMYAIEIPASGGASINNDTEGVGWFTGICTGVLAWRGPFIAFRPAALNDALVEGTAKLGIDVTAVAGSTTAATNHRRGLEAVHRGSVTGSATSTTLVDSGLTESATDHWIGRAIIFTSGALAGQGSIITGFTPATDTLTFAPALNGTPSGGDEYVIL